MTFKQVLTNVFNWIYFGISFLGVILIYAGFGTTTNLYFVGIGFVLLVPAILYFVKLSRLDKKLRDQEEARIHKLIKSGDQVIVNLEEATIKSNSYLHEVEVDNGGNNRLEKVQVNHNVVIINAVYRGTTFCQNIHINMETKLLKMHFALQKNTLLYIDPNTPENNYLDLRFLGMGE